MPWIMYILETGFISFIQKYVCDSPLPKRLKTSFDTPLSLTVVP